MVQGNYFLKNKRSDHRDTWGIIVSKHSAETIKYN